MKSVKIYGQQNSGTIYLQWLLKRNLEIDLDDSPRLGWKHRLAPTAEELKPEQKENTLFVCLVKNPYPWLLSMHKRPYHHESLKKISFTDFLSYSFGDYRNPMVMWNQKNRSYVALENHVDHYALIRYEDLLADITTTLNGIADKFGLEKPTIYKNIKNLLSNNHGIHSKKFHRDFYIEEKWKKALRPEHIELINEYLDLDLMKQFNYEIL